MHYWLCLLCSVLTSLIHSENADVQKELILSSPDEVATLNSDSSVMLGGVVSPLSGSPCFRVTDLIAKGAESVCLSRVYIPPFVPTAFNSKLENDRAQLRDYLVRNYRGWEFFPHQRLQVTIHGTTTIRLTDPNGATLDYIIDGSGIRLAHGLYGISNSSGDLPSGKYDPRNTRIVAEDGCKKITVYAPDGAVRYYRQISRGLNYTQHLCHLEKEVLPNGKVLKYQYNERFKLISVVSMDPQEQNIYAWINVQVSPEDNHCHFTTSSSDTVDYLYTLRRESITLKEKNGTQFINLAFPPILTHVSSPMYRHEVLGYCPRFLLENFQGQNLIFTSLHDAVNSDGMLHMRVRKLFSPVGPSDELYPVHEFTYDPPIAGKKHGYTKVNNSDGTSLIYHFNPDLLIYSIQNFGTDGQIKKEKLFYWEDHRLIGYDILDETRKAIYRKSYELDRFGNPIVDILKGELTGDGEQQSIRIDREFSQDGRNLLLKEEYEEGKTVKWSYLPQTNLVTCKLTLDKNTIILREFFQYDSCNNLIEHIADDGSTEEKADLQSVTQRNITRYTLRQQAPFLHMPESREELYLEKGKEKLLKRTQYFYDQRGNVCREDIYDSDGAYVYSLTKEFNERGDLLSETNPIGQKAEYHYDAKGRCKQKTNYSNWSSKFFDYDLKGRLKTEQELGINGEKHIFRYTYDQQDRCIQKTNPFQLPTNYLHDPIANQVIKTDFPSGISVEGQAVPITTSSTYDSLGRETSKTDANGNTTYFQYNAYNSPTEVTYADGSKESYRYYKNGNLRQYTDQDGLTTTYTYDALSRILSKTYSSASGDPLAEETYTYKGSNLIQTTDKLGKVTQYTYDGAGRKICENFAGRTTHFIYDTLSRVSSIIKENKENTLHIHYKRDLLDRVLEESKTDAQGHLLYRIGYTYDEDGNRRSVIRFIEGNPSPEIFTYDTFHRLIEHQDPLGHSTTTQYDEDHINEIGQKVLLIKSVDPHQTTSLKVHDALGQIVEQTVLDPHTISRIQKTYDPQGNLIFQRDHVYENGQYRTTQTTHSSYSNRNHLESCTRAYGSPDARTTFFTYTPGGRLETKAHPNGTVLSYTYDAFGYVNSLHSSDRQIKHLYQHNALGQLLSATDQVLDLNITRELDPFGNVLKEELPQLKIESTYDDFDRLLTLTLPNAGSVHYTYDPLYLKRVERRLANGQNQYTHNYDTYDLDGNIQSQNLIGNLGILTHTYDQKGRIHTIDSPYFSQENTYDAVDNLSCTRIDKRPRTFTYDALSQLLEETKPEFTLTYGYDSLYNRTNKNGNTATLNVLNELQSLGNIAIQYDLNGNQILKHSPSETLQYTYDPLNQLISAQSEKTQVNFIYDPLGRRISKKTYTLKEKKWKETAHEYYLYHGQQEIGAFTPTGKPKNIKVLGIGANSPSAIAIELEKSLFAPILDAQGNICRLIDPISKETESRYFYSAFGEELQHTIDRGQYNPWRFASKRLDPELNLIYFGKRYYDPVLARWLTTDPAGFVDSVNLYQYVYNNPFRHLDADGQFLRGKVNPVY